ncbi:MAG: aminotransferase class I/II-fold pyridoxal phosphate-dependent enzyme [Defluviitaleaceae bacterium]|nr:aminotransferase class I/II-fold pyridoxal phosphate-dependent enzyme [Defluviitaleaceae bacterium]
MYQEMQTYLEKGIYPFHMPGHKRNPMFFPQGMANLDLTEIPGMDNLHWPQGIIRAFQEKIAGFYGADESFLLVNGSSGGIIAAMCAVCSKHKKIYIARNSHISTLNGMALAGADATWLMPETTPDGLCGGIKPEALDNMEEGAVVFIVSPTYEGFVSDIKEIAARVHARGGVLIVDEAHGAHFRFNDAFPTSALELGADIVVQSFHKTLPALGQTAVLHVKDDRVDTSLLKSYIQTMQTTSPSYILMGQLDYALKMLWNRPEIFETYVNRLIRLRNALTSNETPAISLMGTEQVGSHGVFDYDIGKLLFRINVHEKPEVISKMLSDEYLVEMEMAIGFHLLAMTSVADTDDGFQRLWGAMGSLSIKLEATGKQRPKETIRQHNPEIVVSPSHALHQEAETVLWEAAPGRVAAEVIAVYPPGIALVVPGERIPEDLPQIAETIRVIK